MTNLPQLFFILIFTTTFTFLPTTSRKISQAVGCDADKYRHDCTAFNCPGGFRGAAFRRRTGYLCNEWPLYSGGLPSHDWKKESEIYHCVIEEKGYCGWWNTSEISSSKEEGGNCYCTDTTSRLSTTIKSTKIDSIPIGNGTTFNSSNLVPQACSRWECQSTIAHALFLCLRCDDDGDCYYVECNVDEKPDKIIRNHTSVAQFSTCTCLVMERKDANSLSFCSKWNCTHLAGGGVEKAIYVSVVF